MFAKCAVVCWFSGKWNLRVAALATNQGDILSKRSRHPAAKVYRFAANPEGMKDGGKRGWPPVLRS
jgi:hypothetical protein